MEIASPLSKNERIVTIINTDVPGGSRAGVVAMVEITAMLIGQILQCYSIDRYENPQSLHPGVFLERGCPKSLYRPGSSTDVLLFQKGRVRFDPDILSNMNLSTCSSRFSAGLGRSLVETDVLVRSGIASAIHGEISGTSNREGYISA
jgi:phosphatidylserine decarboxylase